MKKIALVLFANCFAFLTFGQAIDNQRMIVLGKAYKDFMFRNEPTKGILKEIRADVPKNLKVTIEFIAQSITTKNKLLAQPYLSRPDDEVLKQIYIIRAINHNLRVENYVDNNKLIDSLSNKEIPIYELVDT